MNENTEANIFTTTHSAWHPRESSKPTHITYIKRMIKPNHMKWHD